MRTRWALTTPSLTRKAESSRAARPTVLSSIEKRRSQACAHGSPSMRGLGARSAQARSIARASSPSSSGRSTKSAAPSSTAVRRSSKPGRSSIITTGAVRPAPRRAPSSSRPSVPSASARPSTYTSGSGPDRNSRRPSRVTTSWPWPRRVSATTLARRDGSSP
jgi:hypothetical protein